MKQGIHVQIELNPSKFVKLTVKEFDNLSFYGVAVFFINHPIVFEQKSDHIRLWSQMWRIVRYINSFKFEAYSIESAEVAYLKIPNTHRLKPIIVHKFEKFFLREDEDINLLDNV